MVLPAPATAPISVAYAMAVEAGPYGWRCSNCHHDWSMHGIRHKRGKAAAFPAEVWCQEKDCRCRVRLPNEPAPPKSDRLCDVDGCVLPRGHEPFGQFQHLYPGDLGASQ